MDIPDIITRSRDLVIQHYVFPDLATELAGVLAGNLDAGRYRSATTPENLGKFVTEDLQSLNRDQHLRLKFHAEEQPDVPSAELMTAEARRNAARTMNGIVRVERLDGDIAVLELERLFPPSIAGDAIASAMTIVAEADGLVLDLRGCRGGSPDTVALICGYLFGEHPVHLNDMYEREGDRTTQSWTPVFVPGRRYGPDKPICVLTGPGTFSGGEELAYDLQQLGRATLIGETTGGGAHPRVGFRVHPHLELTVPTGRAINPISGTNWEGVGVVPDVAVPAATALDTAAEILKGVFAA